MFIVRLRLRRYLLPLANKNTQQFPNFSEIGQANGTTSSHTSTS